MSIKCNDACLIQLVYFCYSILYSYQCTRIHEKMRNETLCQTKTHSNRQRQLCLPIQMRSHTDSWWTKWLCIIFIKLPCICSGVMCEFLFHIFFHWISCYWADDIMCQVKSFLFVLLFFNQWCLRLKVQLLKFQWAWR